MTANPELLRRSPSGRPNPLSVSEQEFYDWLVEHGWQVAGWECEEFFLGYSKRGNSEWLRPDCKLSTGIFLEHTDADEILSPSHLPELVRQRNLAKDSGKDWISPNDYLDKKSTRIARAEKLHGITIVLLPAMIRQQLASRPLWLHDLIDLRRTDPGGYDEFLFQALPTYLLDELPVPA